MNTSPNKRKRRLKSESFQNPKKMSQSSSINQENADLTGNKWKRRLHSLRRSLSKKKVTNLKEFEVSQNADEVQECSFENKNDEPVIGDITFDNRCNDNIILSGWQQNYNDRQSQLSNAFTPDHSPNLDSPIPSDNNKANVKKRKGFNRRTKGDTVRGKKFSHSTSQQDLHGSNNKSLNGLDKQDSDVKKRRNRLNSRKNKRLSLFSSWFKLPSRTSSDKNLKRRGRRISVSTGNFNEEKSNFKLLTDVKLLRDPGYISSSADSLDLGEEKYQSLRRSRASLIDIKWHKHARSEGNLASPASRNHSLSPSSTGTSKTNQIVSSKPRTAAIQRARATKQREENRKSLPGKIENCLQNRSETWEDWDQVSPGVPHCSNSLGSFGNVTEDDDVYLTAEDDSTRSSPNLYLDSTGQPEHESESNEQISKNENLKNTKISADSNFSNLKIISVTTQSVPDVNGNSQQDTQAKQPFAGEGQNLSQKSEVLHVQQTKDFNTKESEIFENNAITRRSTYICKSCQLQNNGKKTIKPRDFRKFSLGQLTDLSDGPVVSMRCMQCKSSRLSKNNDTCHDVLITRPPKKPAPKPPALMKNKSKSLTALSGKFPVLSEQLDLNETSSLHKLNDSCSDNLCELLLQSKDTTSPTSEGVYVGIMGDQGVILRKRRVYPKQKRVVSMPSELLENVMEIEGAESQESTSETSNGKKDLQNSESEVYLSCNSNAPSSYNSNAHSSGVLNSSVEKELCMRSVSISSIDVQDVSMKKKIHSQSVPCLAFNKNCLDNLKTAKTKKCTIDDGTFSNQTFSISKNSISRQSSAGQSLMSLNFQQSHEGSDETSDKVRY